MSSGLCRRPATGQSLGVCRVQHTPSLDIGEHSLKPLAVEPMLKLKVFEKMKCACCGSRPQLLSNLGDLPNCLRLSQDPGSQQVRDQGQVTELQKKHRRIKRLGNRSLGGELLVQKLLKSPLATGRNSVNGTHTPTRYPLLSNRSD